MLHNKKYIIILIVLVSLIGIVLSINFYEKNKPVNIIKSRLNFTLPSSSKVIHFDYDRRNGHFDAKILIDKQNIEHIKNQLIVFFKQEHIIIRKNDLPNFENAISWWDMDKDSIEVCYYTILIGKRHLFRTSPRSIPVWAFISKQSDGMYYLYISYY